MTTPILSRERRLEAMALADGALLVGLADAVLETFEVEVSRGPTVGLLMVRVEEPSDRLRFNFIEVTVSEAEVTTAGLRGYALVMGRAPEKALAGAILDLAVESGHAATGEIEAHLVSVLLGDERRQRDTWARVSPTRVRFEEMAP